MLLGGCEFSFSEALYFNERFVSRGEEAVTYIEELGAAIESVHHAEARHVQSVPVTEIFQGKTLWDGVVEVFDLIGHDRAKRVYAWFYATGDGKKRHVSVLHITPVDTPQAAVMAAIVQHYRSAEES